MSIYLVYQRLPPVYGSTSGSFVSISFGFGGGNTSLSQDKQGVLIVLQRDLNTTANTPPQAALQIVIKNPKSWIVYFSIILIRYFIFFNLFKNTIN